MCMKKDCPYFEVNCGGKETDELNCICPKYKAYLAVKDPQKKQEMLDKLGVNGTEKMDIMLQMQKVFASKFHKIDNLTNAEIDKWTKEYLICIEDEILEASEFLPIYEEVVKEYDEKEYSKELIDVLHFVMDAMLVAGMDNNILKEKLDTTDVVEYLSNIDVEGVTKIDSLHYLLRDLRLVRQYINWKHWKRPKDTLNKDALYDSYVTMLKHLFICFKVVGMSANDVFETYINKNIENQYRQYYGY